MTRRSLRDRNASAIAADEPTEPADRKASPDAAAPEQVKAPLAAVPDPEATKGRPRAQKAAKAAQKAPGAPPSPSTAPTASRAARKAPVGARPAAGEGRLVLWTPEAIRARMQTHQQRSGQRYRDQVLDAIEATHQQLPELIAAAGDKPHVQGSIFERVIETEPSADRRVQLTIRGMLDSQLAVIDQLVTSTGAGSRSNLVNTALDAHLPH